MPTLTRRNFLGGAAACGGAIALSPRLAFAAPGTGTHTLVVVSLRGGMDGLSAVVPVEAGYFDRRPTIAVPEAQLLDLDGRFGLHPVLAPLHERWNEGTMAVVHGAGTPTGSRSHFEETDLMEHGVGRLGADETSGWLGRHLSTRPGDASTGLSGTAISSTLPRSLAGFPAAVAVGNIGAFAVRGVPWRDRDRVHRALGELAGSGSDLVAGQAEATLGTIDLLRDTAPGDIPTANGAVYPDHHWGRQLRQVAQLIRADLGLEVATVDFGGWDTHGDMGTWDAGLMRTRLGDMGSAIAAFLTDVDDLDGRVTVVVVSEFGRRVAENDSRGLDHGRGGLQMLFGDRIAGGVHGDWLGLDDEVLDRGDVPTITDYRATLAEITTEVLGNPAIDTVFPGYSPTSLGVTAS